MDFVSIYLINTNTHFLLKKLKLEIKFNIIKMYLIYLS